MDTDQCIEFDAETSSDKRNLNPNNIGGLIETTTTDIELKVLYW